MGAWCKQRGDLVQTTWGPGTNKVGPGTNNVGPGTTNVGPGTNNVGPGIHTYTYRMPERRRSRRVVLIMEAAPYINFYSTMF